MQNSGKRPQSSRQARHLKAIEKYQHYENHQMNKDTLADMIKGEKKAFTMEKPGEFVVVATDKKIDKNALLDIPLKELLDGTKTFSQLKQKNKDQSRLKSASLAGKRSNTSTLPKITENNNGTKTFNLDDNSNIFEESKDYEDNPYKFIDMGEPKFTLTRNLKNVTRKQNSQMLSPSARVFQEYVNEKYEKEGLKESKTLGRIESAKSKTIMSLKSSSSAIRPLSAKFLIDAIGPDKSEKLETCNIVKTAVDYDNSKKEKSAVKKNSYTVISRTSKQPKYISGFETVDLEKIQKEFDNEPKYLWHETKSPFLYNDPEAELKIEKSFNIVRPKKAIEEMDDKGYFLPLEYYNVVEDQELNLTYLFEKYKDKETQTAKGRSRWFKNDGSFDWRPCTVLMYDADNERYEILWTHNNTKKSVGRINLIFDTENMETFERNLKIAEEYRKLSEVFMKYNYMIDKMDSPTTSIPFDSKDRIMYFTLNFSFKLNTLRDPVKYRETLPEDKFNCKNYLIPKIINNFGKPYSEVFKDKKYSLPLLNDLSEEINKEFVRSNHKIEFNISLPFSEDKQAIFRGYLDEKLFVPISQRARVELITKGCVQIEFTDKSQNQFVNLYKKCCKILHQAQVKRLKSLQSLNEFFTKYDSSIFFLENIYDKPKSIEDFTKAQELRQHDTIRDLKSRMYDSHFDIMDMVDAELDSMRKRNEKMMAKIVIEADRKKAEEKSLPTEVLQSLKSFQSLVNMLYERSVRGRFELSINRYIEGFLDVISKYKTILSIESTEEIGKSNCNFDMLHKYQCVVMYQKKDKKNPFLEIELNYEEKKDKKELKFRPPLTDWKAKIVYLSEKIVKDISSLECLRTKEIGAARITNLLHIFVEDDNFIVNNLQRLDKIIEQLLYFPRVLRDKIDKTFTFLLDLNSENLKKKLKRTDFEELKEEIIRYKNLREECERIFFQSSLNVGLFSVKIDKLKGMIIEKLNEIFKDISEVLIYKIGKENEKVNTEINQILKEFKKIPNTIEEMHSLQLYIKEQLPITMTEIQKKISDIMSKLNLLEEMRYKITKEDFEKSWSSFGLPQKVYHKKEKCIKKLGGLERKFAEDLMKQQGDLAYDVEGIKKDVDKLMKLGELENFMQISKDFAYMLDKIDKAILEGEIINRREAILKWKKSDFSDIDKLKKDFMPYYQVWTYMRNFYYKEQDTLSNPLHTVDRESLTQEIQESWAELNKLEKTVFKIIPHMYLVTLNVKKKYESFRPYLPVLNDLKNPALKHRHISKLAEKTGLEIDIDLMVNFQNLLNQKIMNFKDEIRDISEIASKELNFEKIINKMKSDWKNIKFDVGLWRDTGCYILKNLEPILEKLDEDVAKTMGIAASPFIKFLENDVSSWKTTLSRTQDIIDIWCKVQKSWQYLQPIFYSEDIIRQMPKEGNKYLSVDKIWRGVMIQTFQSPLVLDTCMQARMMENFQQCLTTLDQVTKGLNDYLNFKRTNFPRFYFLSNEELLSILAQTREPQAVQRHLPKCFEGIDKLTFEDKSLITGMNSLEGEHLDFYKPINPLNEEGVPLGVEDWLGDVERNMQTTLKEIFTNCLKASAKEKREEWLFNWPSQLVVVGDQTLWTSRCVEALNEKKQDSLKILFKKLNDELLGIVALVRTERPKTHRGTLGVLVVIEVHAKDVVEGLIKSEVNDVTSFEWLSQMRYYVERDTLYVKMVNTERKYGFEYLGNQPRLVITPMTDRCYRTLMSALQMSLGGSPEGPAGTGKTETVKDLAKALAKHCVVFNCSDSLDISAMSKFFKGLCSCGSWACFDEFNRIELEVLSVIAQQILTIQTALLRDQNREVRNFLFEGTSLPLNSACAIFTTMNPGYSGRSELPDNLKALFRPVAMVVPNYEMIAEISLYSYGYINARPLAIKIVNSLKLSSEQLSTQSHYDFGMRAVKAILLASGTFKRQFPDINEALLVLRAIGDCNIPKFTSKDVPLFKDIMSDLFPDDVQAERNYEGLEEMIRTVGLKRSLELKENFFRKIIEFYDTLQVRHGVMLVGSSLCGKTEILKTLSSAINKRNKAISLKKQANEEAKEEAPNVSENNPAVVPENPSTVEGTKDRKKNYQKVIIHGLNPKSITSKMLFGFNDEILNEWQDGIAAKIFRECFDDKTKHLKWILFDGPVDSLWIESLNTVLDDNKKLCLANGETIKVPDEMSLIFEVEDLVMASPATVSRCGMVYMEPEELGWRPFFINWFKKLPGNFENNLIEEFFIELFEGIVAPLVEFSHSPDALYEFSMSTQWLVLNYLKMFECFILKNKTREQINIELEIEREKEEARQKAIKLEGNEAQIDEKKKKPKVLQPKDKMEYLALAVMAGVWSFGAVLNEKSRVLFDTHFREIIKSFIEQPKEIVKDIGGDAIPAQDLNFYEIFFDWEKRKWSLWTSLSSQNIANTAKFHEIYIPTTDSIRHHFIVNQFVSHNLPCLIVGKTGTGKTIIIKKLLLNDVDAAKYTPTITAFSANTSCEQVLDVFESKLEKQRRRKGVYGPLIGTKNIIFIDDLNMPTKEEFGAQPPLELVRQWFSMGGWYDKKSLEFKQIIDIQFVGAMGVNRSAISMRTLRNFNLIYINDLSPENMELITTRILTWGFRDHVDKVRFMINNISTIIIRLYKEVSKTFLPLPKKSHYYFNLRDLMKVLQGIVSVPANKFDALGEYKKKIFRLWIHESVCVYSDRLINAEDKLIFFEAMKNTLKEELSVDIEYMLNENESVHQILFGNFLEYRSPIKLYVEIEDKEKLVTLIQQYIEDHNQENKFKIDIVLFEDAVTLLIKINRILSITFGHALLIGLGGSGRHTLTRLAAFMQDYDYYEDWTEFLREMIKSVSLQNENSTRQAVFILSDSQINDERYLEDINNLINIGEIPNLFTPEDKENLTSDIKEIAEKENKKSLMPLAVWELFINKCRMNLHIVLNLSPIGDRLRLRIRNFPSFVNCTSTIWIFPWSKDALFSVACHFLEDQTDSDFTLSEEIAPQVAKVCVKIHQSVEELSDSYLKELGRYNYVTAMSYKALLRNFRNSYQKKFDALDMQKETYSSGVKKLVECSEMVERLTKELDAMKPILIEKTKQTEEIMKNVEIETAEAEKQRLLIQADEEETAKKAQIAFGIKAQCQERLAEAEPELEAAIKALRTLKDADMIEMKALQKPPVPIKMTMEAVCIMLEKKPKRTAEKTDDYWEEAKKLLNEPVKFKKTLEKFKKDQIPDKVIQKFAAFLDANKKFVPKEVAKASEAAEGLCKWVLAINGYHRVFKSILPLREELEKAEKELQAANEELNIKKELLAEVQEKCKALNEKFNKENFEKQKLMASIRDCEIRKERASKLTDKLKGEKISWKAEEEKFGSLIENLLGDNLISSGFISYLGAFPGIYRKKVVDSEWIPQIKEVKIKCSDKFNLAEKISSPIVIQDWILNGLPFDDSSIENTIILENINNWPLIIDPQQQASKFFIKMERNKLGNASDKLVKVKPGREMLKTLEQSVRMGYILMVLGLGENIEAFLDNVLSKNIQVQSGIRAIQIGANVVEYNDNFRLYLFTGLSNPHFTPEILTKVTLLNYSITPEGLKDQMLSFVAREEEPKDEEEKLRIITENSKNMEDKKKIELKILELLKNSDRNKLLDDEKLINTLTESKNTSEEMDNKIAASKQTEERININRANYEPVANFSSNLFFGILSLERLDPMYQFSLEFFMRTLKKAIKQADKPQIKNVKQRVENLLDSLRKCIFYEMSRSLYVKHKLMFSFLLVLITMQSDSSLDNEEVQYFLTGIVRNPSKKKMENPDPQFFEEKDWNATIDLSSLANFVSVQENITKNLESWKNYINNMAEGTSVPDPYSQMNPFSQLLLVRIFRPDLLVPKIQEVISSEIGDYFLKNIVVPLEESFKESSTLIPLIFVLSPGDDLQEEMKKFSNERAKILITLSLGKGQGENAETNIRECSNMGNWVLLQNCHLATSWLPNLELILEDIAIPDPKGKKQLHPDFRIWLTSMSSEYFPSFLLKEGIKMTKDPPKGVRANMFQIYSSQQSSKNERNFYNSCEKPDEWKKLFLGLTYFHAIVRERKRFGPVGWNIMYDFNESDFKISVRQLHLMLNSYPSVPFIALNYLTGECNYGGKVTDDLDRRLLMSLLSDFYDDMIMYEEYKFSPLEKYYFPDDFTLEKSIAFINELPENDPPELFGLHSNAAISSRKNDANILVDSLLVSFSASLGKSETQDKANIAKKIALEVKEIIPNLFDIESVSNSHKIDYFESMNTVLIQDLMRYNTLLRIIQNSLIDVISALEGLTVMTVQLEKLSDSLSNNTIPELWAFNSYPSRKKLLSYVSDLKHRTEVANNWIEQGKPIKFWVSALYFPQSFFTGVKQNFARKQKIAIDKLSFSFEVVDTEINEHPVDGCYIDGLFLEGARWNYKTKTIDESIPGEIYDHFPAIWVIPTEIKEKDGEEQDPFKILYSCPTYKTTERKGTLSSTGHSTNFIISVKLPSLLPEKHWIKRGAALLAQLDD